MNQLIELGYPARRVSRQVDAHNAHVMEESVVRFTLGVATDLELGDMVPNGVFQGAVLNQDGEHLIAVALALFTVAMVFDFHQ